MHTFRAYFISCRCHTPRNCRLMAKLGYRSTRLATRKLTLHTWNVRLPCWRHSFFNVDQSAGSFFPRPHFTKTRKLVLHT